MTPSVQKRSIPLPPSLREVSCHSANADGTTEGVFLDKENCRYRKRICENKATPSVTFGDSSLGEGAEEGSDHLKT